MANSGIASEVYARKNWSHHSDAVADAMFADVMKGYVHLYETLTGKIDILVYNGNFDMSCAVIGTEAWISNMSWAGAEDFKNAPRHIWTVRTGGTGGNGGDDDGEVAGYWKTAMNFTHVVGYGGGHWYPHDQPQNALIMVEAFLQRKPL